MEIVFGDLSLGVLKGDTRYIFAYNLGGVESISRNGFEFLYRCPSPAFWRATTDNDRGNGFSKRSCLWMGADLFYNVANFSVTADGTLLRWDDLIAPMNNSLIDSPLRRASKVSVRFLLSTCTQPQAEITVTYTLEEDREGLLVDYLYSGTEGLPELPVCGMKFILPFRLDSFEWDGLSGETYPDRLYGAQEGHWVQESVPVCPYAVAQDYGMHMGTHRLEIKVSGQSLVLCQEDEPFSFSLLPNSAQELEMAWHPADLPLYRRTYLTVAAALRGVGGIDSWGSDVSDCCHIDPAQDHHMSFRII